VLRFYVHKAKLIQHQSSNQEITTMLLLSIILGTLLAGVGSVLLAALFRPGGTSRFAPDMLGFAAGALLSTACLHLLPEAFEGGIEARRIGIALLGGLVLFFVLDKAELWHHGHEHHAGQAAHPADAGHAHPAPARSGVWAVLVGDSVLGALASLAVLTHEVPHHFGDLVVLGQSSRARQRATSKVALAGAGAVTVIGGLVGYALLEPLKPLLPYFLAAAASSFVYVALADLIPQLQKPVGLRQSVRHIAWLLLGIAVVALATSFDVD
jgi:zinc and cadmium transporter